MRAGIILAGGKGTRLGDCTKAVSKQLLPVYDKPMIYYPLTFLLGAGISDILIISTPEDLPVYERLLGDGSQFGCRFTFLPQAEPKGLAQAYIIGKEWIGDRETCMVLGDNLFYGWSFDWLQGCIRNQQTGPCIVGYPVADPRAYGVVEFDPTYRALSIEEKPQNPRSKYAVPGLYIFDENAVGFAEELKPSPRGELEITGVIQRYIEEDGIHVQVCETNNFWFDAGTPEGLLDAAMFVSATQRRNGIKIGCPYSVVQ
jgi:glucose-1-phosphate thymidylyltransferase